MERDDFDQYIATMPEPKIELLDGRLVIGNGAGNMQLLRHLLEGWGAAAALPMALDELWWQALSDGFRQFAPPGPHKSPEVWRAWAAQLNYIPELAPAGPMLDGKHRAARQSLMMGLFGSAREHKCAHVSGRDVIMRLGTNAFTPDVFAVGPEHSRLLNKHYLDGPADLAIEVLLPGHEAYDREVKLPRYEAGRVGEYWIVDPVRRAVDFLRWSEGGYRSCAPDPAGRYHPAVFPGLAFQASTLWEGEDDWGTGPNPFFIEGKIPRVTQEFTEGGVSWGDLPFDPRPRLEPRALSFEEFASWAPEAKFELIDGKPWVGGSRGSRNVLGLLLRTEGLARAVTVLHPRQWILALAQAKEERAEDAARREHWWQVARRAADLLRAKYECGRLVVIGDLVQPPPLNLWSLLTLVAVDSKDFDDWRAFEYLRGRLGDEQDINLIKYEHATRAEQQEVDSVGVEI